MAALECVDNVAINQWPTATETIRLLRPDVFAKGAEYRDKRTPEIICEQDAVAGIGAMMAYIDDLTASSSHLINKHLSPFPPEVVDYLDAFAARHAVRDILDYVQGAANLKVLVVGETIIDEYVYCNTMGRSSKAPVVAAHYQSEERHAGGAAAVANHLAGFCGQVGLLTMVGERDSDAQWVADQLDPQVRLTSFRKSGAPTIVKRRYRETYFAQPMFEVYLMDDSPLGDRDNRTLCRQIAKHAPNYDLVLVTDYGHAMLTDEAIHALGGHAPYLAVNTQTNAGNVGYHTISKYARADYACLTEGELRLDARRKHDALRPLLAAVGERLQARRVVATQGSRGCEAWAVGESFEAAPSLAVQVVDRVGAGDAFLAMSALAAVQNAPLAVQTFLGNVAGAHAVATVGNRNPLQCLPLCRHIESLFK